MKIAVCGETRLPVLPYGPGGLGRATHEIATQLAARGHDVTLFAPAGAEFAGKVAKFPTTSNNQPDVLLDYSHTHLFGRVFSSPVLNLIGDRECPYCPPCAVVETEYMKAHYPTAKVIPAGIDVDAIPFIEQAEDYLVFMGLNVGHKQPEVAREAARLAGREIKMIGPGFQEVDEAEKWNILGHAAALLAPYTIDASPRSPLEAAACGTPTLCLNVDGTKEHIKDGLTGFACHDAAEMARQVEWLPTLNRANIRIWAKQNHDIHETIANLEGLLEAVAGGARW